MIRVNQGNSPESFFTLRDGLILTQVLSLWSRIKKRLELLYISQSSYMITDLRKSQEIACKLRYKQSGTAVKYD